MASASQVSGVDEALETDGQAVKRLLLPLLSVLGLLAATSRKPQPLSLEDEQRLSELHPDARTQFRALLRQFPKAHIRSGIRSEATQNALYAQGRTTDGLVVTNARGCMSWHVQGRAVDLSGLTVEELREVAVWWKKRGGHWGGDFTGFFDPGHFEWHPGLTIEDVCRLD